MQIISQDKDPTVGINGFEEVGPEWLLPKKKKSLFTFWKKARFEGEEREIDLPVHAYCITSPSSLIFSIFLSIFFLIFFFFFFFSLFSFTLFFFLLCKNALFFNPLFRARQEPFYSACRDQGFTILPLNRLCLVWAYLPTTRSMCHSLLPNKGTFHFSVYRNTSFLPRYKCFISLPSRHVPNGSPSNLPLLGSLSSQQDVPPKRAWAKPQIDLFPSPHHQTIPPLPLTSDP